MFLIVTLFIWSTPSWILAEISFNCLLSKIWRSMCQTLCKRSSSFSGSFTGVVCPGESCCFIHYFFFPPVDRDAALHPSTLATLSDALRFALLLALFLSCNLHTITFAAVREQIQQKWYISVEHLRLQSAHAYTDEKSGTRATWIFKYAWNTFICFVLFQLLLLHFIPYIFADRPKVMS